MQNQRKHGGKISVRCGNSRVVSVKTSNSDQSILLIWYYCIYICCFFCSWCFMYFYFDISLKFHQGRKKVTRKISRRSEGEIPQLQVCYYHSYSLINSNLKRVSPSCRAATSVNSVHFSPWPKFHQPSVSQTSSETLQTLFTSHDSHCNAW